MVVISTSFERSRAVILSIEDSRLISLFNAHICRTHFHIFVLQKMFDEAALRFGDFFVDFPI